MKFYRCGVCGNIVALLIEGGGELVCCGQPMKLLEANTVDASKEKHVPVIVREGGTVRVDVGSVEHPSIPEHYIQLIAIEQGGRVQIKWLKPGEKPSATFEAGEEPVRAYEYCNLHGLWTAAE